MTEVTETAEAAAGVTCVGGGWGRGEGLGFDPSPCHPRIKMDRALVEIFVVSFSFVPFMPKNNRLLFGCVTLQCAEALNTVSHKDFFLQCVLFNYTLHMFLFYHLRGGVEGGGEEDTVTYPVSEF
jgi:hypothetical protein